MMNYLNPNPYTSSDVATDAARGRVFASTLSCGDVFCDPKRELSGEVYSVFARPGRDVTIRYRCAELDGRSYYYEGPDFVVIHLGTAR